MPWAAPLGVLRLDQITLPAALAVAAVLSGGVAILVQREPERCDICAGCGCWDCVICAGTGRRVEGDNRRNLVQCVACVGRGKRLCRKCKGSGYSKQYFG
jgi:DnaJ-class molecular chaperone